MLSADAHRKLKQLVRDREPIDSVLLSRIEEDKGWVTAKVHLTYPDDTICDGTLIADTNLDDCILELEPRTSIQSFGGTSGFRATSFIGTSGFRFTGTQSGRVQSVRPNISQAPRQNFGIAGIPQVLEDNIVKALHDKFDEHGFSVGTIVLTEIETLITTHSFFPMTQREYRVHFMAYDNSGMPSNWDATLTESFVVTQLEAQQSFMNAGGMI